MTEIQSLLLKTKESVVKCFFKDTNKRREQERTGDILIASDAALLFVRPQPFENISLKEPVASLFVEKNSFLYFQNS